MQVNIFIPAYVRPDQKNECADLLVKTIESIPAGFDTVIHVVLQGADIRKRLESLDKCHLAVHHLPEPIGKWNALKVGVEKTVAQADGKGFIAVFIDGDAAFTGADMHALIAPVANGDRIAEFGFLYQSPF